MNSHKSFEKWEVMKVCSFVLSFLQFYQSIKYESRAGLLLDMFSWMCGLGVWKVKINVYNKLIETWLVYTNNNS